MFVDEVALQNFRNFKELNVSLSSGINLFYGNNGSGKTSFLESLQLYWNGKSFRTKSLNDVVSRGDQSFTISGTVVKDNATSHFGMDYNRQSKQRRVKFNGSLVKKSSLLASKLPTLYFSPGTSYYSSASPRERRDVLFWFLFHVEHQFAETYSDFRKALSHRNALLREVKKKQLIDSISKTLYLPDYLESQFVYWETRLVDLNSSLEHLLVKNLKTLNEELAKLQIDHLTDFNYPKFETRKLNTSTIENVHQLQEKRLSDVVLGYTSFGFHRADISFVTNEKKLSGLSRGEEKTVSLFFLIAILCVVRKVKNNILFLIDDIGSELDFSNIRILLNTLNELSIQCFISAIDKSSLAEHLEILENYKLFHVKQGWITED